jgi:hypothetical protein
MTAVHSMRGSLEDYSFPEGGRSGNVKKRFGGRAEGEGKGAQDQDPPDSQICRKRSFWWFLKQCRYLHRAIFQVSQRGFKKTIDARTG